MLDDLAGCDECLETGVFSDELRYSRLDALE